MKSPFITYKSTATVSFVVKSSKKIHEFIPFTMEILLKIHGQLSQLLIFRSILWPIFNHGSLQKLGPKDPRKNRKRAHHMRGVTEGTIQHQL